MGEKLKRKDPKQRKDVADLLSDGIIMADKWWPEF
jgi:hypothetical protein